jgi:hypothetical protein
VLEACQQGVCCCVLPNDADEQHCSVRSGRKVLRTMLTVMLQHTMGGLGNVSADTPGQLLHMP